MSALPSKWGSTRGCCFASFSLRTAETDERKLWARDRVRRHEFISLLGGAAAAWPLAAHAQQAAMPMIGFLNADFAAGYGRPLSAFLKGLGESGYVDGRNVGNPSLGGTSGHVWCEERMHQAQGAEGEPSFST